MENKSINNQDKVINIIFSVIFVIIMLYFIYYIVNYTELIIKKDKNTRIYDFNKGTNASKNLDLCKRGCVRGVCKNNKNNSNLKGFCKYDFQCNYCKDRKTNQFYVDLTNYEEVLPDYNIQEELSKNQSEDLNNEINDNNDYIDELNNKIRKYNGITK